MCMYSASDDQVVHRSVGGRMQSESKRVNNYRNNPFDQLMRKKGFKFDFESEHSQLTRKELQGTS